MFMPEQKLAFCWMQKVASENFAALFNHVNNNPGGVEALYSSFWALGVNLANVTREKGWRFAAFVRDPLDRYLSAFLSKCVPVGNNKGPANGGAFCHGPTLSVPLTLEDEIALFEARVRSDAARGALPDDFHWKSQSATLRDHCGMDRFNPAKLDFLGHITYDPANVNHEVQALLGLTSLPNISGLSKEHFPLPKGVSLLGCPKSHCTEAHAQFQDFYRNRETARLVQGLLQDDYDTFNFTKLVP
mmetsp:Transcript_42764/g.123676  ORF Transcript_42764/g.123676 Transcript_42764/m.123676 type:complete len:245 (+) Transcript_42764:2-736(+)